MCQAQVPGKIQAWNLPVGFTNLCLDYYNLPL